LPICSIRPTRNFDKIIAFVDPQDGFRGFDRTGIEVVIIGNIPVVSKLLGYFGVLLVTSE